MFPNISKNFNRNDPRHFFCFLLFVYNLTSFHFTRPAHRNFACLGTLDGWKRCKTDYDRSGEPCIPPSTRLFRCVAQVNPASAMNALSPSLVDPFLRKPPKHPFKTPSLRWRTRLRNEVLLLFGCVSHKA